MIDKQPLVEFCFLGQPQLRREGQPINLNSAKAVALLAYLAATPMPQSRERLLDLFWPDSAPDAARKNLRNTLWTIRKAFGEEVLSADDDRLSLQSTVWTDLTAFSQLASPPVLLQSPISNLQSPVSNLQSTLALYRGSFLDGLTVTDAPDFEIWLTAERERLGQLYLRTLTALIDHYRAEADWVQVTQLARRALSFDNLHEPIYRMLMEAHARLGERAEALRQYEALQVILAAELGVEPLPETEDLRLAILNGDLQPIEKAANNPNSLRLPSPTASSRSTPRLFVGRRAELDTLTGELQQAAAGLARLVLLSGEMGLGKSRLWQEWSASLPTNLPILATRGLEATRNLPFVPLIELLRSVALQRLWTSPTALASLWLAELTRLLPEIRLARPELPAPASLPPEEEQYHLFEALVQSVLALKARPLVFFFDDVHWADRTTLAWLGYLFHRCRDQALLLILSYRPEDAPPPLGQLLAGWGREGLAQPLSLPQLSAAEAAALVASLGVDSGQIDRLYRQSSGNPYFLLELCQAAPDDVPPALAQLISARLDRLPQATRQVLQSAAVLEPVFEATTLRRTSGRSEEEVIEALDDLRQAAVLVEQGRHYFFAHPLVAVVVRQNLSGARRAFLHRRAAEALEASYAPNLPPGAGSLTYHYAQAGESAQAAHFAQIAAGYALSIAAPVEAADFYRLALAQEPTPERYMGLGQALQWQGNLIEARQAYQTALAEFTNRSNQTGAAMACLHLAESYLPAGQADETSHWARQALLHLDHPLDSNEAHPDTTLPDPAAHALAHLLLGSGLLRVGPTLAEAEHHLNIADRLAARHNLGAVAAQSQFELGNLLAWRNDLSGAVEAFETAIRLAQAVNLPYLVVLGHNNAAYHAMLAGNLTAAHQHVETGLALAEAQMLNIPLQYLYSTRGEIALAERQWAEAENWFQRGLVEAEKHHNQEFIANYQANLSLAARGRGDLDQALLLLKTARNLAVSLVGVYLPIQFDLWLVELYRERGQLAEAEATLSQAEARLAGGEQARLQAWAKKLRQAR